jgi:hypothetical protein
MTRLGIDRRRFVNSDRPNSADESAPIGGKLPIG